MPPGEGAIRQEKNEKGRRMIKKLGAILLAAALTLTMGLTPLVAADDPLPDPPAWAECVTLYAGQNMDVGTVCVWNDGTTLYVKYETSGDWMITETHLAVATSKGDIPQNRTGNPIPGQFAEGDCYDPPAAEDTFAFDLDGWTPGIKLYVAAHAVVGRPIDDCWETVWQIGDVETDDCAGNLTNYANEFNWRKPDGDEGHVPILDCEQGPALSADTPPFADPFIVGTTPTDEFPYNSNTGKPYATDFDVQWAGSLPFGGRLTLSWSPGASGSEKKEVSGYGIPLTTFAATGSSQPGQGWFMNKYPLVEHSVPVDPSAAGNHTINLKHSQGDGTFWDWVRLEKPCEQWETAWADGERFVSRGNWATYFTYEVQFTPDSIDGLVLWLDADAIEWLDDGQPVETWEDLSGAGNHATQATEASRPTYKTGILNGKPVVRFDGADDILANSSPALPSGSDARTVFAVFERKSAGTNVIFDYGTQSNGQRFGLVVNHSVPETSVAWWGHRWGVADSFTGFTAMTVLVPDGVSNTNGASIYIDGVPLLSSGTTSGSVQALNTVLGEMRVGGHLSNASSEVDIAEILIYDRALSGSEREDVEAYLMAKYGP